jgi:hypothetical protein
MRLRIIIQVIAAAATLASPTGAFAQTNPAVNISSVVRGGVVVVSYDLMSTDPNAVYTVALEASSDGGKTYGVQPKTVKGDVGTAVHPGTGKQITWEAARDVENLEVDRYRYRVAAQIVRGATTPPPPKVQKGKGALWGGLAMVGGGAFLAISSMTSMKTDDYTTNQPLLWTGLGLAGGGVAVAAVGGKSNSGTALVFRPDGFAVQHRMPLRLPF